MSVAIDTDASAQEKSEFDAAFETTDEQTADDEPICDLSCGTAFTIY